MRDGICEIPVGIHPAPYWRDARSGLVVCSEHRAQYEESIDDYGPFEWERFGVAR